MLVNLERNISSESAEMWYGRPWHDVVRFCLLNYEKLYFIIQA